MQGTAETCVYIKPRFLPSTFGQAVWKNDPLPYFTDVAWRMKKLVRCPAADGRDVKRMKTPDKDHTAPPNSKPTPLVKFLSL